MRIPFTDEEEFPGQFDLWEANCERSIAGKRGQSELKILRDALLAMPDKRLIRDALEDEEGGICAIACYGKAKGVDLSQFDPDYRSDEVGVAGGMPPLVAWTVVLRSDEWFDRATPEERYEKMLAWVNSKIQNEKGI